MTAKMLCDFAGEVVRTVATCNYDHLAMVGLVNLAGELLTAFLNGAL